LLPPGFEAESLACVLVLSSNLAHSICLGNIEFRRAIDADSNPDSGKNSFFS
jgi:hypothetical protein